MKFPIIKNRKYFYIISGVLFLGAILSIIAWGLQPGLDFTGGSLMQVKFEGARPANTEVISALSSANLGEIVAQPAGESEMIVKFKSVTEDEHQAVLATLKSAFSNANVTESRFDSVGPVIGQELLNKSWWMIVIASLAIICYIGFAFRKVSKPVASWKYGVAAILALVHDIVIVIGLFCVLGHFFGTEVDSLFITALLTIMGFSVHDTIVVFDRTRENLSKFYTGKFDEVVNDSVNQTLVRSINTSVTVLLVLLALYLLGGESIKDFALALLCGIAIGTYSSIFVASPLIVDWNNWNSRLKKR